jgi:hypothetical protein
MTTDTERLDFLETAGSASIDCGGTSLFTATGQFTSGPNLRAAIDCAMKRAEGRANGTLCRHYLKLGDTCVQCLVMESLK